MTGWWKTPTAASANQLASEKFLNVNPQGSGFAVPCDGGKGKPE